MRDIIIKPALNGFVVRMGCQRIVFCDRDIMIRALNDYLDDPNKTESQYTLNSMHSKQFGFTKTSEANCLVEAPGYGSHAGYPTECSSSIED